MRAIVPVGIACEAEIEDALAVVRKIALDYTREHKDIVFEEPEVQGVMSFNSSDVEVRIVIKVVPGNQWQVERNIRRAIKKHFDERNVEIPFPRHVVYVREESQWDNIIDTEDTPEEFGVQRPEHGELAEFGMEQENLGMVHQKIRRLQRKMEKLSKFFCKNGKGGNEKKGV